MPTEQSPTLNALDFLLSMSALLQEISSQMLRVWWVMQVSAIHKRSGYQSGPSYFGKPGGVMVWLGVGFVFENSIYIYEILYPLALLVLLAHIHYLNE